MAVLASLVVLIGDFEPWVWLLVGVLWALPPLGLVGRRMARRRLEEQSRRLLESVADRVQLIARA